MRILFLTPQLPYPPNKGTSLRNFNIIKNLACRHEIHLLTFCASVQELSNAQPLNKYCARIEVVTPPKRTSAQRLSSIAFSPLPDMALRLASNKLTAKLEQSVLSTSYDLIQVEGIELMPAVIALLDKQKRARLPKVVFDDHNAEYVLQQRAYEVDRERLRRWPWAFYSYVQCRRLRRYERNACRRTSATIAVSEEDREALLGLDSGLDVAVVPNGVDTEYFRGPLLCADSQAEKPCAPPNLVFTGTMDFRPNIDAMTWFCKSIFPQIIQRVPDVHLYIVGKNPTSRVRELAGPSVTVTGEVEDVRPYLAKAAVYVVPMRYGGGVRLKVLEAMAYGVPIVSTRFGAEGVMVRDGENILLAQATRDGEEFARKVLELLDRPALGRNLVTQARLLAEQRYDWKSIVPRLEELYLRLNPQ